MKNMFVLYYAPPRGPKGRVVAPRGATRGCICIWPHFWLLQVTTGYYRLLQVSTVTTVTTVTTFTTVTIVNLVQ